ncbi:MAG: energy-coupling factor ABC transporter permease, partial [Planctomycetaceae bacterium]|nr:energy-coupling factor ABC transporter permease [Planctomycetaceae bacterium]
SPSMHIQDGVLSPAVCAATGAIALGAVSYSVHRLKQSVGDRTIPLTGMMAALVFAGQMVNFPIGAPVSGHLLGGVLAATVVGPWAGCVAMTLVLFVQWALFSDGGLFSLGANVLHMAVIGAWGGHAVRLFVQRFVGDSRKGIVIGSVFAAWASVMAAAALFCLEFRLSWLPSEIDFSKVFTLMVSFHSLIGLGEALITGVAISFVLSHRPELICRMGTLAGPNAGTGNPPKVDHPTAASITRTLVAGLVIALAIAAFLSPFASSSADGLEVVLAKLNIDLNLTGSVPGLFEDYENVPVPVAAWQTLAVSIAGIGGTLAVFVLAWLLGKALPAATPNLNSEAAGE